MPDVKWMAELCAKWAQREGILERVTEEQFKDIALAFMAGYVYGHAQRPKGDDVTAGTGGT